MNTEKEHSRSELEKQINLIKSVNRSGTHRCSLCDTVNNERIETNIGDYHPHMAFVNDSKDPLHFVCISCDEKIQELRDDYEFDDWLKGE